MQGFDAVRAALNPFSLAQRRKVPAGHGRGRQIVFAVDSSSFSEHAVRFGLDHVARANDSVSFACVYKKANLQPPELGPFVDGVPVSTERDEQVRREAERKDKARCESSCARFVADAKAAGVAASSAEILSCGASGGGGSVADVLEQYAKSTRADVLVVGSRGVGTRGSLLGLVGLGSVSEHLVRHAEANVLVVKRRASGADDAKSGDAKDKNGTDARRVGTKTTSSPDDEDDFLGPPEQGFAKGARR